MTKTDDREMRCACGGMVKAGRNQTLDEVRRIHNETCPRGGLKVVEDKS